MSDKLESPTFPLGGFLPIGLCRGLLRRHCQNAVDQALRSASLAIGESVLKKCSNTLEGTVHGLKDVASTIEQRVWSIVTGQKVSSPVVVIADPPEKQAERMEELRSRLNNLRTALTDYQAASFGKLVSVPVFIEPERPKLPDQSLPAPDPSKGNLASELQTRSCPACNRVYKVMFDFFAHWQYELSTNEESQAAYAAQGGFCPLHTWQLASIASPQGLSQGYPRLVERIARTLSNLSNKKDDLSRSVAALISDTKHCQACHHLESAERGYLEILRAFLLQSEGQLAYAQSQGLCLRHLSLLLGLDLPADVKNFVLHHSSTILQAMAEDMESFALKRDALRRGLYNQNEMDAHMRAIIHLASARHICLPREEEENG